MCTRVVYLGPEDTIITARSMDWKDDMGGTNLWAFPQGMKRDGVAGPNSIKWASKYGSVVATCFDKISTDGMNEAGLSTDGMNEAGLVANMLYLTETKYPTPTKDDPRKPLAVSLWAQYVLDNYATVDEAVKELEKEPFYIVSNDAPDPTEPKVTVHLSISDPTGDSAIFEYIEGILNIHHNRKYQVMTNSPTYDQQLALNVYWEQIGGTTMLPGTNRAADRFVRASFYINAIPKKSDIAIASVFSVIHNVSVPLDISTPDQPTICSTRWRVVADHKNKLYYFESTCPPNVFWVNLSDLDFTAGQPTKKLTLKDNHFFAGNMAEKFEPTEPFSFVSKV